MMYMVGFFLGYASPLYIRISQAIESVALVVFIPTFVLLIKARFDSTYLRAWFFVYILWFLVIFARSNNASFSYDYVKVFLFGEGNSFLVYMVPLIVMFPRNFTYYRVVFRVLDVAGVLFLGLCLFFIQTLMVFGKDFDSQRVIEGLFDISAPVVFILLTYRYHSARRIILAIVVTAITLFFSLVRARRGLIFISTSFILYSVIFFFFQTRLKFVMIYMGILMISLLLAFSNKLYNIDNNKVIGFLYNRVDEDSRTPVEDFFYEDMTTQDWIIGKGFDGTYFAPKVEEDAPTNYRSVIETGYLQLVLKGGLINLGLFLIITFPAFILGLFFSKNVLSKAAAMFVFQCIIDLEPQNSVFFNLNYVLVWIFIGICYSKEIRNLTDSQVMALLHRDRPARRRLRASGPPLALSRENREL